MGQFSLALLWALNTVLHVPSLIAWSQNVKLGLSLDTDPSLGPAIAMLASLAVLWQHDGQPRVERKYYAIAAIILQGAAISIAAFAMVSLYRLTYIISAVFVVVALHQALSPEREVKEEEDAEEAGEEGEEKALESVDKARESQASQSQSEAEMSDPEYEYEYKVNLVKRRVKTSGQEEDSVTDKDTGLGTEPYDHEDDDEKTCNDLNSTSDDLDDKKTI